MEYNKKQFIKSNDKKILHKVKKHWVVLSMSLLALLGGGAVAHQMTAHADTNNKTSSTNPATTLKNRINASLTRVQSTQNQQTPQSNDAVHNQSNQVSTQQIDQQANALHNRILSNAALASNRQTPNKNNITNQSNVANQDSQTASGQQNRSSVNTSSNNSIVTSNNSQISNNSQTQLSDANNGQQKNQNPSNTFGEMNAPQTTVGVSQPQADEDHWIWDSDTQTYLSDGDVHDWETNSQLGKPNFRGMTYKISPSKMAVEFTSGVYNYNNNYDSDNSSGISDEGINYGNGLYGDIPLGFAAHSYKFDSDVDANNTIQADAMFLNGSCEGTEGSYNPNTDVRSIVLSRNSFKDIKYARYMFTSDINLRQLTLPNGFGRNIAHYDCMFSNDKPLYRIEPTAYKGQPETSVYTIQDLVNAGDYKDLGGTWTSEKNSPYTGNYDGLNYIDHGQLTPGSKGYQPGYIEFVNGTLTWNSHLDNGAQASDSFVDGISYQFSMPSDIQDASKIVFDSDVDTTHLTNVSGMFYNAINLQQLILPDNFGQNITGNSTYNMISGDSKLNKLRLPKNFGQHSTNISYLIYSDDLLYRIEPGKYWDSRTRTHNSTIPETSAYTIQDLINAGDYKDLGGTWTSKKNSPYTGVYDGLNYIDHGQLTPGSKGYQPGYIEFVNGNLTWNCKEENWDAVDLSFLSTRATSNAINGTEAPSDVANASKIKFDSDVNTDGVTDAYCMLSSDINLRYLVLSNNFGKNIVDGKSMFHSDPHLQSLTLPANFGQEMTNYYYMFSSNYVGATTLYLIDNGNMITLSSDISKFDRPTETTWTANPSGEYDGLHYVYHSQNNSVEFKSGTLDWNGDYGSDFIADAPTLVRHANHVTFDNGLNVSSTHNLSNMLANDSDLQSVNFGDNFKNTNISDMTNMMGADPNLTSVDLSNFDTSNVKSMANLFTDDRSLQSVNFGSNWDTSQVTDMAGMFFDDYQLLSIDLSRFNTSKVTSMLDMFSGDRSITNLDVSKFNTSQVRNMGAMFYGMPKLQSLNLSNFDTSQVRYMNSMFANDNLNSITGLNHFNTANVINMNNMFFGMKKLVDLDLSNFDTHNVSDMRSLLGDDYHLSDLTLGSNFTTQKAINPTEYQNNDASQMISGEKYMFESDNDLKNLHVASNDFKLTPDAMLSSTTHQLSTSLVGLTGALERPIIKLVQQRQPLLGDYTASAPSDTDVIDYYVGNNSDQIVGSQTFHGTKGTTDYTAMEMTSDTPFGLDTSKYYITQLGNQQIQQMANDNLDFSGQTFKVQVGNLQQGTDTIVYALPNGTILPHQSSQPANHVTESGTYKGTDSDLPDDLTKLSQGDFLNGDSDEYGLTPSDKIKAGQLAKNHYSYLDQTIKVPIHKILDDNIEYVDRNGNPITDDNGNSVVDHFRGLNTTNDWDIIKALRELHINSYNGNQVLNNYYVTDQGIKTIEAALHNRYDYSGQTIQVQLSQKQNDTVNYVLSNGSPIDSVSYAGKPNANDEAMNSLLYQIANQRQPIYTNGDYNINSDYYLTNKGLQQAQEAAAQDYNYNDKSVQIVIARKTSDQIKYVNSNGTLVNFASFKGVTGNSDHDMTNALNEIANGGSANLTAGYYVTAQGQRTAQKDVQHHYDYKGGQPVIIQVAPETDDRIHYVLPSNGNAIVGSDSFMGDPLHNDSDMKDALQDIANINIANGNGKLDGLDTTVYKANDQTVQAAQNALSKNYHYQSTVDIPVSTIHYSDDVVKFRYHGQIVGSLRSQKGEFGNSDSNFRDATADSLFGRTDIQKGKYYVNSDAQNARFNQFRTQSGHFMYNGTTYTIDLSEYQNDFDTVEFVTNDNQIIHQESWSDFADQYNPDVNPSKIIDPHAIDKFDPLGNKRYQLSPEGQYEIADLLHGDFNDLDYTGHVLKINIEPRIHATFTALYTINGQPKFKTVATGLKGYRVDNHDYLSANTVEHLSNGDNIYLNHDFYLPSYNNSFSGLMVNPLWHSANNVKFRYENQMITIPLITKQITDRFKYVDQNGHTVYIADITGENHSYTSKDNVTTGINGVEMPAGIPNIGSSGYVPEILKGRSYYRNNFGGYPNSVFFDGETREIPVHINPSASPYAVNYINETNGHQLGTAKQPVYSDFIKAINNNGNKLTSSSDKTLSILDSINNLGNMPKDYNVDKNKVIAKSSDSGNRYVDLNVVPAQVKDYIQFNGAYSDDYSDVGQEGTIGKVNPPAGTFFSNNQPQESFTFDGGVHTFNVYRMDRDRIVYNNLYGDTTPPDHVVHGKDHTKHVFSTSDIPKDYALADNNGDIIQPYQEPSFIFSDNRHVVDVIPYIDDIKFDLSGSNIPSGYAGLTGVLSSDHTDYYGNGTDSDAIFSDQKTAPDVKGLLDNYHIAGKQSAAYDGLIHRIQIAPNTDTEYIKYVYTHHNGPKTGSTSDVGDTSAFSGSSYRSAITGPYASETDITSANAATSYGLPAGYQLVNSNNSFMFSSAASGSANFISIPVEPVSAKGITVKYINETGQQLAVDQFSGGYNSTFASATNYTDEQSNSHSVSAGDHIVSDNPDSKDYRIDLSQQSLSDILSDYRFDSDPQSITVPMIGKLNASQSASSSNRSNAVNVTINEVNSDNTSIATSSSVVYLHGSIGSFVSLKPSDLLPGSSYADGTLSGYQVSPSTAAGSAYYLSGNNSDTDSNGASPYGTGTLYQTSTEYSNDQPHMVPGSAADTSSSMAHLTFTYESNANPGTITVTYLDDQTGNKVSGSDGYSDIISPAPGTNGQTINVISSDSSLSAASGKINGREKTAKGENVPSGYTLADKNMPNTIYTVNHSHQYVTIYVRSNSQQQLVTNTSNGQGGMNYPLTINLVEQLYKNGQINHSDDSDGWTNGRKVIQAPVQHISGDLNRQAVLHSPSYTPTGSNSTVVPASDGSYTIQFSQDGKSLNVLDANGSVDNGITTNDAYSMITSGGQKGQIQTNGKTGIVFNYNVYAKGTTQYKNRIHYISYSDMDNSDDITKTFHNSDFLTTVSDAGNVWDKFSDASYRKNVPKGYQFYGVLKVNPDSDVKNGNGAKNVAAENSDDGLTTFGKSHDQDEYIEVIPNASSINVHYVDQNGNQVAEHTFSGQNMNSSHQVTQLGSDGHGHGYNSMFGQFISETGNDSIEDNSDINLNDANTQYKLAAQPYHTADGSVDHNSTFMFGRQPQDVKVTVIGKNETSAPITVKYLNHNGTIVRSQAFFGRYNDSVDVTGQNNQNVPSDYYLDSDQQTTYHFGKDPQTVYLDVSGKVIPSHKITIERVMEQSDGTPKIDDSESVTFGSDNPNSSSSDVQGSIKEINPDSYTPDGYAPDYNHDSVQFITMNDAKGTMPNKIVFYYQSKETDAAPVTVHFVNQRNGQLVGNPIVIQGDEGDTVKASNSQISANVPQGYSLSSSGNQSVTFGNSPQTMLLNVGGNSDGKASFMMNVITEDSDGSNMTKTLVKISLGSSHVGDHFVISPYGIKKQGAISGILDEAGQSDKVDVLDGNSNFQIPKGYHATNSDSDVNEVINPDGSLAPLKSVNFIYQRNKSVLSLDKVRIHYISDNVNPNSGVDGNGVPTSGGEIDQESDEGIGGIDKFDLTPYLHDLPESVSQFYDIDTNSPVIDSKGRAITDKDNKNNYQWTFGRPKDYTDDSINGTNGISNIRDVYIKIHKTDDDQPIVVD